MRLPCGRIRTFSSLTSHADAIRPQCNGGRNQQHHTARSSMTPNQADQLPGSRRAGCLDRQDYVAEQQQNLPVCLWLRMDSSCKRPALVQCRALLDLPGALILAIKDYKGGVLIISHNKARRFLVCSGEQEQSFLRDSRSPQRERERLWGGHVTC